MEIPVQTDILHQCFSDCFVERLKDELETTHRVTHYLRLIELLPQRQVQVGSDVGAVSKLIDGLRPQDILFFVEERTGESKEFGVALLEVEEGAEGRVHL